MKRFTNSQGPSPLHPRIRAWAGWRDEPGFTHIEVEVRQERDGLVLRPARLFVMFMHGEVVARLDETDWDYELDEWLVTVARANGVSLESEKRRFSLWLRGSLRATLRRFGDGFFNWVLLDVARRESGGQGELGRVLAAIHRSGTVSSDGRAACQEAIEAALSEVGHAIAILHRDPDESGDVLAGALALYLDERFSVTNRSILGFA